MLAGRPVTSIFSPPVIPALTSAVPSALKATVSPVMVEKSADSPPVFTVTELAWGVSSGSSSAMVKVNSSPALAKLPLRCLTTERP